MSALILELHICARVAMHRRKHDLRTMD